MTKTPKYLYYVLFFFCLICFTSYGQISNITISDKFEQYRDSLKKTPYPWKLPILGAKLRKMGVDIPYPQGIGFNFANSRQNLQLSDAFIGFDTDNLIGIDGIARFSKIEAEVTGYTVRYDFWLLPFLNLFGIGGTVNSKTNIQLGHPFELEFNTNNNGTVLGWGTVIAGAVGPLVVSGDFTMAWTFMEKLDKPNQSIVASLRSGYVFRFPKHPDRNLAVLIGTQYLGVTASGSGTVDLEKLVGISPEDKQNANTQLNEWYNDLTNKEQEVLAPIYNGASKWLSSEDPLALNYRFNKKLYYPVSLNVGVNFQLSHRYTLTSTYSFLGSRNQLVIGLGYRFGWKGKNLLSGFSL